MFTTPPDLLVDLDVPHRVGPPLGALTWYRTGGPAALLASPGDADQLSAVVTRCREAGVAWRVLGAGANLLVRDAGFDGVVVRLDAPGFRKIQVRDSRIVAGGGVDLFKLVPHSARAGLDGLVQVAGIPATVGGAVRMNAGGSFGDVGSRVDRLTVLTEGLVTDSGQSHGGNTQGGQIESWGRDRLDFGYRRSNLDSAVVVEAEFALTPADPAALLKRYKEIYQLKKNSQPMGDKSAGCCFKNPPAEAFAHGDPRPAGRLVDEAGLKGYTVGGATVSPIHANFITARPGATTSADILAVIEHVQRVVRDHHGVTLQREIVVW